MTTDATFPYIGLIPFTEEDARFFFGRERECTAVIDNLFSSKLTILYGATGAGKSSLLRAGVAFRLHQFALQNTLSKGTPEFIVVVFSKWLGDPLAELSDSIERSVRSVLGDRAPERRPETPASLTEIIKYWSELTDSNLLIILDQFEEYFLYHEEERGDGTFYEEFSRAVNRPDLRASFLISLRADSLSTLDHFKGRIPKLFANYMRVGHLDHAGALEAIKKPLEVYNTMTGAYPAFTIEEELVNEVFRQVRAGAMLSPDTRSGAVDAKAYKDRIETSFLQLVMTRLWEAELNTGSRRLRLTTLKRLGNAHNIIKTHLNTKLQVLPSEKQEIAAEVFRYLVTPGGTKIAFTVSDLADLTELPSEHISRVLEELSHPAVRILRPFFRDNREQSEKSYEIFHDVLAPAILDWRAQYLAEKEKARVAQETKEREEQERARLAEEAQRRIIEEERRRKREERRVRQLVLMLIGSAAVTLSLFFLSYYALTARQEAERARKEIEIQRAEASRRLEIISALDQSVPYFKAVMRGHEQSVIGINFSPDGKRVVTASTDGTARVWDAATGERVAVFRHEGRVNSATFSPADGRLVVTTSGHMARVWDADAPQQPLHTLAGHTGEVNDAQFSPDGRLVVTFSDDATARVWETETGHQVAELSGHLGALTFAAFSPDSQSVLTSSIDGTARMWDARTGAQTALLQEHRNVVNTAAFSPDGTLVVTASSDYNARIWNAATGQSVAVLRGHTGSVVNAEFSPDGTLITTSSTDKTARVWDVKSRRLIRELSGHKAEVVSAKFSRDDVRVITASADNTVLVWEAVSGRILFELRGHTNVVNYAVFSPDGESAATAGQDNTARTWDIAGAGGIRVIDLSFRAEPDRYVGPCPVGVRFIGRITVTGSGTVKYRFVRRSVPGRVGPERSIEFFNSGTKEVSTTWQFGGSKYPNPSGSFYLEIIAPEQRQSEDAEYNIKCQLHSGTLLIPTSTPTPAPAP